MQIKATQNCFAKNFLIRNQKSGFIFCKFIVYQIQITYNKLKEIE